MPSFKDKWVEVLANARAFGAAALAKHFVGNWRTGAPVKLEFLPPAREHEVAAVEDALGHPLPGGLRTFFLEASAGLSIRWLLPATVYQTAEGITQVRYHILPPEPLLEIGKDAEGKVVRRAPKTNGCFLEFSLGNLVRERDHADGWTKSFEDAAASNADDAGMRAHYTRFADVWRRGIALTTDGGGNVLAVDRDSGTLMFLFHDGSDEPGWFLEHDLIDFMVAFSRLGFPGLGVTELLTFQAVPNATGPVAKAYAEAFGKEAAEHNLAMPTSVVISPDCPNGRIWRDWLGLT